jgi:hypothetical protein
VNGRRGPLILAVVGVAILVALFFVLKDDEEEPAAGGTTTSAEQTADGAEDRPKEKDAKPDIPEITLTSGQPKGGVEEIEVQSGEAIAFEVTSDVDDEVHMHGYDIEKPLPAGKTVRFEVPADIEGVFEVESHDFGTQIAEVSVVP